MIYLNDFKVAFGELGIEYFHKLERFSAVGWIKVGWNESFFPSQGAVYLKISGLDTSEWIREVHF
jgi:hypothetical protein